MKFGATNAALARLIERSAKISSGVPLLIVMSDRIALPLAIELSVDPVKALPKVRPWPLPAIHFSVAMVASYTSPALLASETEILPGPFTPCVG